MSIALDVATLGTTGSGTSLSFTKVNTGSNLILFFCVSTGSSSDLVTDVTYNGVSAFANLIGKQNVSGNGYGYIFYLLAPASGSHSVVITTSLSTSISCSAVSYTGVDQSTAIGESTVVPNTVQNPTTSLVISHANSWMIAFAQSTSGQLTAGTGAVIRGTSTNTNVFDSNGALSPGTRSMTINNSGGTTGVIMTSFFPVGAAIVSFSVGTFTVTGYSATIGNRVTLLAAVGAFVVAGFGATIKKYLGWTPQSKSSEGTWTSQSKS